MKALKYFVLLALIIILPNKSRAVFLDDERKLELKCKIQSRASFRTSDSRGFTAPRVSAGTLVQHRNLAYLEVNHSLSPHLKYHLVGRFLYEGIYDYGPGKYRKVRNSSKNDIDDFKKDVDLWEGYLDYDRGPLFVRVGRQNISWGETDMFQLLDRINPLDNTWGGIFEDLDDRRIPLWMLRSTYNLGDLRQIQSAALEFFINPDFADQEVSPVTPYGTPYAFPAPQSALKTRRVYPGNDSKGSRYGLRLQGVIANNFNFSLAHYRTILIEARGQVYY